LDLKNKLISYSISDDETRETMKEVFQTENYLIDPHGAVGYFALNEYLKLHPKQKGIFLETAHPVKFYDVVEPVIHQTVPVPGSLQPLLKMEKKSILINAGFENLKEFLMDR
jgi:threonine synthase